MKDRLSDCPCLLPPQRLLSISGRAVEKQRDGLTMLASQQSPSFPVEYSVTELDALGYSRRCMMGTGLLLGSYGLAIAHLIPVWMLPLAVLLVLPRWMINVHELLHIYDESQLNPFICLMGASPVPLSAVSLSYQQIRQLHFAHHAAPTTTADPDAYHIRGHWLLTAINAFTSPEQSALRWIARHGLSVQLGFDLLVKLIVLVVLAWLGGWLFVLFLGSVRVVYGLGDLAFFRWVHCHQGEYGSFRRSLPPWLVTLSELIFGPTVTHTTLNHDLHHQNPYIAARSLAAARALLTCDAEGRTETEVPG